MRNCVIFFQELCYITINGQHLPSSNSAKCLGYHWHHDLSATPCIDNNILKARKAFFGYGSIGVFQGELSSMSCHSVVETCVLPILLYGCENWCLTSKHLEKLESFLGEVSKRLLQLPRWYNNTPATVICGFKSITSHCLCRKLNYLHKLTNEERSGNIGNETFKALLDDVESICLVRECRELE